MAVTFDAVGPSSAGASATNVATASWTHTVAAGPCAVTAGCGISTDASTITATCGGTAMTSLGKVHNNNSTSGFTQLFGLANVSTGAKTIQLSGGGGTDFVAGSQSYAGADTATPFGTGVTSFGGPSATTSSVVVTGTTAGNMVAGACSFGAATIAAGAGSTSRWVINAFTSSAAGNACGVDKAGGGSVTLNWTCTTGDWCGAVGVEVKAAAGGGAAAVAPAAQQVFAPGWHPGPGLPGAPGGVPFYAPPAGSAAAAPQVTAAAAGAGQVTTAVTLIATATAAGAGSVTASTGTYITGLAGSGLSYFTDSGGRPKLLIAENPWGLIPNAGRWSGTYQTTIDNYCNSRGGQGYSAVYTDPLGNTENGGASADGRTWDGVYPFTVNGTAGTTAGVSSSATIDLNTTFWTRVDYLIAGCARNNMTAMLNVGYDGGNTSDYGTGAALTSLTATQHQQYGAALAARYASTPNIIWVVGNDYFGGSGTDTAYSSLLTGLRGGGDTHVITIHNNAETTSRRDFGTGSGGAAMAWGLANAQFNFVYQYAQTYFGVEYALAESSPITTIWGDGYFYSNSGTNADRAMRQFFWWALASGAVGCSTGDERIWQWDTNAAAAVTSGAWYNGQSAVIRATIEPLPGWQNLQAAPGSGFITAGRGTRFTGTTSGGGGTAYGEAATDNYIAASLCADKSLALIYFSAGTASSTITIDQTKLATGYTATWVDPASGAQSSGTPGATYANHGTNSAGDRDWVLILQGPSGSAGTAAAAGAGSVTAAATVIAPAAAAGAGAATAKAAQAAVAAATCAAAATAAATAKAAQAAAAAAGSAADVATQAAGAGAAGGAAVTAKAAQIAGAAAAAAGSAAAAATQITPAAAAGAGAVSDVATQIAGGTAAGAGSVTAVGSVSGVSSGTASIAGASAASALATQRAAAAAAGAAAVTSVVTQAATGTAAGAAAATAAATQIAGAAAAAAATAGPPPAVQIVTAAAAGAAAVTAAGAVSGQSTASVAGAGAAAAVATQIATATAAAGGLVTAAAVQAAGAAGAAAGSAAAAGTQAAPATAAGAGSVTAAGSVTGAGATATAAGAGTASAVVTQAATATAAAAGSATAAATRPATGSAAAAGQVTAAGYITGTASVAGAGATAARAVQALTATAAAAGVLSALATQRAAAALAAAGQVTATATSTAPITYGTARQAALALAGAVAGQQAAPHAQDGQMPQPHAEGGQYP